jgi:hypothetical protein
MGVGSANGNAAAWMGEELQSRGRVKTEPVPVEIRVEGVLDTVGSLGLLHTQLANNMELNDMKAVCRISANDFDRMRAEIHSAFKALAIDEHRGVFTTSIWYLEPKIMDKVTWSNFGPLGAMGM